MHDHERRSEGLGELELRHELRRLRDKLLLEPKGARLIIDWQPATQEQARQFLEAVKGRIWRL